VLTATIDRPYGYGRIVRHDGRIARVVESVTRRLKATEDREINSGIYAFALGRSSRPCGASPRRTAGRVLPAGPRHDLPEAGLVVETLALADPIEARVVNSQNELAEMGAIVREKKNAELMAAGVVLVDPHDLRRRGRPGGADTIIHPNVYLEGRTTIGERARSTPACASSTRRSRMAR